MLHSRIYLLPPGLPIQGKSYGNRKIRDAVALNHCDIYHYTHYKRETVREALYHHRCHSLLGDDTNPSFRDLLLGYFGLKTADNTKQQSRENMDSQ